MEDEINLLDYWRVIVKRRGIMIWPILFCLVFAIFNGLSKPVIYTSTASVLLVDNSGGGLISALSAFSFGGGGGGGESGGEATIIAIIKSRSLALRVAEKLRVPTSSVGNSIVVKKNLDGLLLISSKSVDRELPEKLVSCYLSELGRFLNENSLNINFRIIDTALPAELSSKANFKKYALLGLSFGFIISLFLVFFLEYFDKIKANWF